MDENMGSSPMAGSTQQMFFEKTGSIWLRHIRLGN